MQIQLIQLINSIYIYIYILYNTQISTILEIAPITSARWYPNVIVSEAGFRLRKRANIYIANPAKSQNMCAASDNIANEPARRPPAI